MKKIFLFGAFTLLSSTIISCTADEINTEGEISKTTSPKEKIDPTNEPSASYSNQGPDDELVVIYPSR